MSQITSALCLLGVFTMHALAAEARISEPVDDRKRVPLAGNVSPQASLGTDQGAVDPAMELPYVSLVLKPSASQQSALDRLLAEQQDAASPDYHHWLTPEEYGDRFGVSETDIGKIVGWLGQHQLAIKSVARAHNSIAFGGTAAQIEKAFGVSLHRYLKGAEVHYGNTANPTIPAAFEDVIRSVHGLHDFHMRPRLRPSLSRPSVMRPRDTERGEHELAPDDIATIYDIAPLYTAGVNGAGQKIVIVGQTQLPLDDISSYRSAFSLPANVPTLTLVPGTKDPGVSQDDLAEADLDVEISGAIARNAAILFVYSEDVDDAFQYAIDEDLAPVLSISYGACELQTGLQDALLLQALTLQANAQGMTIFGPAGDNASLDCAGEGNASGTFPDEDSLSVDVPASIPQVTAVGGTQFNEGSGNYWSLLNTSSQASALSYIPEAVWNESASDNSPAGGGGGASLFFDKPWWQAGTGVPADGVRDVPDVSLSAAADHDGYLIYTGGSTAIVGGTSVSTPEFAAIATLVDEYQVSSGFQASPGLGQINPVLYALASVSGVFHDITVGGNAIPPCDKQRGCTLPEIGYAAGPGYDQASGLGSVDAFNLVRAWHAATLSKVQTSAALAAGAVTMAMTDTTQLTATVTGAGATPTGQIRFSVGNSLLGAANIGGSGTTASAALSIGGVLLASGANTISAQYEGDATHTGAAAYTTVTVTPASAVTPVIGGVSNAASFTGVFAPGGIISVFGTGLAPATATSSAPLPAMFTGTSVTIGGVAAPLYFASPGQLNVQIPYGIPANSTPTLTVYNGEQTASTALQLSEFAPAIFTFSSNAPVPYTTAGRGQEVFLFLTGAGAVSPAVATGETPAAGTAPLPQGAVVVTVGGVTAPVDFVGVPVWSVGAVQINYTVPESAALGAQPVVVSVGGVESAAATLTITN